MDNSISYLYGINIKDHEKHIYESRCIIIDDHRHELFIRPGM